MDNKENTSYQLSSETKQSIARITGLPFEELDALSPDEFSKYLEEKTGKKATYDTRYRINGIPIDDDHIITMGEVDQKIDEISRSKLSLIRRIKKKIDQ